MTPSELRQDVINYLAVYATTGDNHKILTEVYCKGYNQAISDLNKAKRNKEVLPTIPI